MVDPLEGIKPIERIWMYKDIDVDVHIHRISTCRKGVHDKIQRVDYDKIGSSVAMLKTIGIILVTTTYSQDMVVE